MTTQTKRRHLSLALIAAGLALRMKLVNVDFKPERAFEVKVNKKGNQNGNH